MLDQFSPVDYVLLAALRANADSDGNVTTSYFDVAVVQAGVDYSYGLQRLKHLENSGLLRRDRPTPGLPMAIQLLDLPAIDAMLTRGPRHAEHKSVRALLTHDDFIGLERLTSLMNYNYSQAIRWAIKKTLQLLDLEIIGPDGSIVAAAHGPTRISASDRQAPPENASGGPTSPLSA